jgi:hypothetical protein
VTSRYTRGFAPRASDERIVELYREHRNSVAVGVIAGCSDTTVLDIVRRTGNADLINRQRGRSSTPKPPKRLPISDSEIVERYRAGTSMKILVDQTGAGYPRIKAIIQAAGVPIRTGTQQRRLSEK